MIFREVNQTNAASVTSLEEDLYVVGLAAEVFDAIELEEGVSVHPFEHFEGRKHLAVVESGRAADEVVGRGAHHWRLDGHGLLVVTGLITHVGPDPEGALVVGAKIIASHVLLTELVIVGLGCGAETVVSPSDGLVVDLGTPIANFVVRVEVRELVAALDLDGLTRAELSLDLGGGDGVVACIELVKPVVLVF